MRLNARQEMTYSPDQRSIVPYLSMQRLSAKAIYQDLVQALSANAVAYPTVTRHYRAAKFLAQSKGTPDEAGVTQADSANTAIPKAFAGNPFPSVPELSWLTSLSISTVNQRLMKSLGFTICYLYWISHWLLDG
jgi:hypothetical protein